MKVARFIWLGCLFLSCPSIARAEHIRAHGTLDLAKAVGGFQGRELGFGAAMFVAAELPLIPQLGADLQNGTVLLTKGSDPLDPTHKPGDGAHAIYGAVGLQGHPF